MLVELKTCLYKSIFGMDGGGLQHRALQDERIVSGIMHSLDRGVRLKPTEKKCIPLFLDINIHYSDSPTTFYINIRKRHGVKKRTNLLEKKETLCV